MSGSFSALRKAKKFFEARGFCGPLILRGTALDVVGMMSVEQFDAYSHRRHGNDNEAPRQ